MGANIRFKALKHAAREEARKKDMDKAANRLLDTMGMGMEYQVLGITSHGTTGDVTDFAYPFMDTEEPEKSS